MPKRKTRPAASPSAAAASRRAALAAPTARFRRLVREIRVLVRQLDSG